MYRRILVAIDNSTVSNEALAVAIKLAGTVYARLRLLHVFDAASHLSGDGSGAAATGAYLETLRQEGDRILFEAAGQARKAGVEVECMVSDSRTERVGEAIVQQAVLWNADLVVVGTHGRRGISRVLMGSDAEYVVRHAPQNVLSVRGTAVD